MGGAGRGEYNVRKIPLASARSFFFGLLALCCCARLTDDLSIPNTATRRNALVSRLEVAPANVTIRLGQKIVFVATAYDQNNRPVAGVAVQWMASPATGNTSIGADGRFSPGGVGVYTITASAAGQQAQTTVTVNDGVLIDPNAPPQSNAAFAWNDRAQPPAGGTLLWPDGESGWDRTVVQVAFDPHNERGSDPRNGCKDANNLLQSCRKGPVGTSAQGLQAGTGYGLSSDPASGAKSGNFQVSAPILSLPGRGLSLSLALTYNSDLWTFAPPNRVLFDVDADWPAPGWSMGFGRIVKSSSGPMFVEADGTRHRFAGTTFHFDKYDIYYAHTQDGTFINYQVTSDLDGSLRDGTVFYPNGTTVTFETRGPADNPVRSLYPTRIIDQHGNYISIAYRNNTGPAIDRISDTLGRTVQFYYDASNPTLLTAITAPGLSGGDPRTVVRLHYANLDVTQPFDVKSGYSAEVRNPRPWMLDAIYYPGTQNGYSMIGGYTTYGVLRSVSERRRMMLESTGLNDQGRVSGPGDITYQRTFEYPPAPLTALPRYSGLYEDWTYNDTGQIATTLYGVIEDDEYGLISEVHYPDGSHLVQSVIRHVVDGQSQWDDGLLAGEAIRDRGGSNPDFFSLWGKSTYWEIDNSPEHYQSPRPQYTEEWHERNRFKRTYFTYGDHYNQVTAITERDAVGVLGRRLRNTKFTYLSYLSSYILNLPTKVEVFNPNPDGTDTDGERVSVTTYEYDLQDTSLLTTPDVVHHYDGYPTAIRGNLTSVTTCADPRYDPIDAAGRPDARCRAVTEQRGYDVTGNLRGNQLGSQENTILYTSASQYAYPQFLTIGGTTLAYQTDWDINTGLPVAKWEPDGNRTDFTYDAPTLRLLKTVVNPTGMAINTDYDDVNRKITTTARLSDGGAIALQIGKSLNGRGQVRREERLIDAERSITTNIEWRFDGMRRVVFETRPFIGTFVSQAGTYNLYDDLGRLTEADTKDSYGAIVSKSFMYYNERDETGFFFLPPPSSSSSVTGDGDRVRTVDGWGRERWTRTDALGRLVEVVEADPTDGKVSSSGNVATRYSYNAQGKLTRVDQGNRLRVFKYDGLGRLSAQALSERDWTLPDPDGGPQLWSDLFSYDVRSNLTAHVDARGQETNYNYVPNGSTEPDSLDRVQSISYPPHAGIGLTPTRTFTYVTSGDLRRVQNISVGSFATNDFVSSEDFAYDAVGRLSSRAVTPAGQLPLTIAYGYDSLNRVTSTTYPTEYGMPGEAARTIHPDFDVAGRLAGVDVDGNAYAADLKYNAASQLTAMSLVQQPRLGEQYEYELATGLMTRQAVGLWDPIEPGILVAARLRLEYGYTLPSQSVGKTGQVATITNWLNQNFNKQYSYDGLGRLAWVKSGADFQNPIWTQHYEYDRFGNRARATAAGPVLSDGIPALMYNVQNRVTGFGYDAAGNQTRAQRPDGSWRNHKYDAAGHLVQVQADDGTPLESYQYGSDNRRLFSQDETSTQRTYYAWDGQQVIAEFTALAPPSSNSLHWSKTYVYLGSRLLTTLTAEGGAEKLRYHHPDRLGTRIVSDPASGTYVEQATLPFGTALDAESTPGFSPTRPFGDYDRSAISGLDYAVNRFYDSPQGRFTRVDPMGMDAANLANPQSLNLFAYVVNDPINKLDPLGLTDYETIVRDRRCRTGEYCWFSSFLGDDPGYLFEILRPKNYSEEFQITDGVGAAEKKKKLEDFRPPPCSPFVENFKFNLTELNNLAFQWPWKSLQALGTSAIRLPIAIMISNSVARALGTATIPELVRSFRYELGPLGIATLGGVGATIASSAATVIVNFGATVAVVETSIILGSGAAAGYQTLIQDKSPCPKWGPGAYQ